MREGTQHAMREALRGVALSINEGGTQREVPRRTCSESSSVAPIFCA
jgi:hypothetical protein